MITLKRYNNFFIRELMRVTFKIRLNKNNVKNPFFFSNNNYNNDFFNNIFFIIYYARLKTRCYLF